MSTHITFHKGSERSRTELVKALRNWAGQDKASAEALVPIIEATLPRHSADVEVGDIADRAYAENTFGVEFSPIEGYPDVLIGVQGTDKVIVTCKEIFSP